MKNILYLGNKLAKHGNTPTSIDILPDLLEKEGYLVIAVSSIKNRFFRLIHMLWSLIFKSNVDLVLIDTYSTYNFWYAYLGGKICSLRAKPYILICHGGNLEERLNRSSKSTLKVFRNAKANVVPSNFLMDKLTKFEFSNIIHIPNTIDFSIYDFKLRSEVSPNLLWVRAFDHIYNPEMFVEVFEIILKCNPNAKASMVGPDKDGSLERAQRLAKEKNLEIQFHGKLSKEEWGRLSKDFDVFINTTTIDNTPVSVIEAMALGLPVVSTNVGGIPYLLTHEQNGLLVNSNDAFNMANAIKRLIKNPPLSEHLSINGRKTAEDFDWAQVKHLWLELLG